MPLMRGRVAAVLLSFLLVSSLGADCNFSPRYSGQFRATVYDVAIDGDFVWTATGYGVQLMQATANGPELLDAVALPGSSRVIAPNGNGLAYAGSGDNLVVLRRTGAQFDVVRSIKAPGTVNDIVITATHLFVATSAGIAHYDLIDPANPGRTSAILTTSRANVTSLAAAGATLYAADGDATVEVFNITIPSLPQRTGAIDALPRAAAVHATTDGFLFISDNLGQNSDIFSGNARVARVAYGATSFASTNLGAFFVAGNDRTLRAIELGDPSRPAELYERQLTPTAGTNNSIFDLARSGSTLYVAAGDIGLLTFDVSSLAPPFPLLSYGGGATTSALIVDGSSPKAYFSHGSGLTETSLELATLRSSSMLGIIHDSRGSDLLLSNGPNVSLFSFSGTAFETAFRADVRQAVILGNNVVALLADQSVWTVPATAGSAPQQVDLGGAKIAYLARSATAYAVAELREEGTTVLHYGTRKFTVEGVATGGLALNATHAAFFTFRGINLVDLSTGAVTVLSGSTNVLPKQLQFAGTDLLVLGDRSLTVWNTAARTLTRTHTLPANAVSMHAAAQRVAIATDEGMLTLRYLASQPDLVAEPAVNRYYTKAVTGRDRLYLFGSDGVDAYSTTGVAPQFLAAVNEPGLIDVAATRDRFFTLGGDGTVTAYSQAAVPVATTLVTIGNDSRPDAIFTAGNAVWVTVSVGCQSGSCAKTTVVLDPATLTRGGSFAGGVLDVTVSGTRAFALLDLPREIVSFDIANPLFPTASARIAAPQSAKSIAVAGNTIHVLGDKDYTYSTSLVAGAEQSLGPITSTQQIEAAGDCAIAIGHGDNPRLLGATNTIDGPSTPRSLAVQDDRVFVLTEHSIEVWTGAAPPQTNRRRSTR